MKPRLKSRNLQININTNFIHRTSLPQEEVGMAACEESWFETMEGCNMKLWSSVTSAICVCVNNPQSGE